MYMLPYYYKYYWTIFYYKYYRTIFYTFTNE